MTTKQRNRIYKRAYKYILKRRDFFMCIAMHRATKNVFTDYELIIAFEEFFLFSPEYNKYGAWFPKGDLDSRLNALAFCIAMTE